MQKSSSGFLLALVSAVAAGTVPALSKLALVDAQPLVLVTAIFLISGFALLPYRPKVLPTKVSAKWMVATGFAGAALAPGLYFVGLNQTSAVNASLLTNTEVFFTVLLAFVAFSERLSRSQLLEGIVVVIGVLIVSTNLNLGGVALLQGLAGNILILLSSFTWAVDNNLSRITSQRFGPIFVSKYRNMFGGAIMLGFLLATSSSVSLPLDSWPLVLLIATMTLTATLAFMGALARIGVVRTLIVYSSSSIFGAGFAVLILGEGISSVQLFGGALIITGVYLIQRSEHVENGSNS